MTLGRFAAATHVLAVLLLGVLVLARPGLTEARRALANVEADHEAARAELATLPAIQAEVSRLETSWTDERLILPERESATEETLLRAISSRCDSAEVRLDEVVIRPDKVPDSSHRSFDEVVVGVRVTASYGALVKLVAALESSSPWTQVVAFSITRPEEATSGRLRASLEVVTYRQPAR